MEDTNNPAHSMPHVGNGEAYCAVLLGDAELPVCAKSDTSNKTTNHEMQQTDGELHGRARLLSDGELSERDQFCITKESSDSP